MPILAFRTNSKPLKNPYRNSDQILNVDVGELSRLEIVDSFSPTSPSSAISPTSLSSVSSISPHSNSSIYSINDKGIERCFVSLAKIQLHFKPIKRRRSSFRRSKRGKSTHKTGVTESSKAPLNFVLKNLPDPTQLMEYSCTTLAMRARRFSRVDYDNVGFDEMADFAMRQRYLTDAVWRKSQELLGREIRFFKLMTSATAKNQSNTRPKFLPNVFFELCAGDCNSSTADYLFMSDIGDNVEKGDAIIGLSKDQVDECINAISEFHALSIALMDKKSIESMTLEKPEKRKETLFKNWLELKLLKLSNTMFMEKSTDIYKFVSATEIYKIAVYKKFGITPVLCHGDFHAGNVFFDKKSGALVNILDWKLAYASTGLNDVARLLLTSVNSNLRLKHINDWLTLYTTNFNNTLKHLGYKKGFYTEETVRRLYNAEYDSQLLYAIAFLIDMYEQVGGEAFRSRYSKGDLMNENGLRMGIMRRIIHGFELMDKSHSPNEVVNI